MKVYLKKYLTLSGKKNNIFQQCGYLFHVNFTGQSCLYKRHKTTRDFINKHPLCKDNKYVFIKAKSDFDAKYEYDINNFFYNLFSGKHICKSLGWGKNYIVYEYIPHQTIDKILYGSICETTHFFSTIIQKIKRIVTLLKLCTNHQQNNIGIYLKIFQTIKNMIYRVHEQGYIFYDLHFYNILITENYNFYLIDFEHVRKSTDEKLRKNDLRPIKKIIFWLSVLNIIKSVKHYLNFNISSTKPLSTI
jgi:RIO-like serine/threonine protein kinase